jgi:probable HAF family extracellular repeat protein
MASGSADRAFLYTAGSGMTDLGTLGGASSRANGINDAGQIVGGSIKYVNEFPRTNAFIYAPGTGMTGLGTLGGSTSEAYGINNLGQVVGYSTLTNSHFHAFLYSGGAMEDLNSLIDPASGWALSIATAINDVGQIVGTGLNGSGQSEAFLLSPVPEPATLSLLAFGGLLAIRRHCARRLS